MMDDYTFSVRINEGPEQTITVKTGIYMYAAVAACSMLGIVQDGPDPILVEIWMPSLLPDYGPTHYMIGENEYGNIVVEHAIPANRRAIAGYTSVGA
jgi:hypothetical protein